MTFQDMLLEEHGQFAATRMVNLLASDPEISPEVRQVIRTVGLKYLGEPRNFDLPGKAG